MLDHVSHIANPESLIQADNVDNKSSASSSAFIQQDEPCGTFYWFLRIRAYEEQAERVTVCL